MAAETGLHQELLALRRGRGVQASDLSGRLGPLLRGGAGIGSAEPAGSARPKLTAWLESGCRQLPPDMGDGVRAGLAIHPLARDRFLRDRLAWYARQLNRELRTARRRMDDGFARLAEVLEDFDRPSFPVEPVDVTAEGWQVESLLSVVRLDRPQPVVWEERVILADVDGVSEVEVALSLGIPTATEHVEPTELGMEMIHGGRLTLREHPSRGFYRAVLMLPRPLARGERHRFGLSITIPGGRLPAPHYALTPFRQYGSFDLVVRFDPAATPARLWRVEGVPPRALDYPADDEEPVQVDRFGELAQRFNRLQMGRSYGVRWQQ